MQSVIGFLVCVSCCQAAYLLIYSLLLLFWNVFKVASLMKRWDWFVSICFVFSIVFRFISVSKCLLLLFYTLFLTPSFATFFVFLPVDMLFMLNHDILLKTVSCVTQVWAISAGGETSRGAYFSIYLLLISLFFLASSGPLNLWFFFFLCSFFPFAFFGAMELWL